MKLFISTVLPCLMFGLSSVPLQSKHLKMIQTTQNKMMRRMVGWRRLQNEPWSDTMHRMKQRVASMLKVAPCPDFCSGALQSKWKWMAKVIYDKPGSWPSRLLKFDLDTTLPRGRPAICLFDDCLKFCKNCSLECVPGTASNRRDWTSQEEAFVKFALT